MNGKPTPNKLLKWRQTLIGGGILAIISMILIGGSFTLADVFSQSGQIILFLVFLFILLSVVSPIGILLSLFGINLMLGNRNDMTIYMLSAVAFWFIAGTIVTHFVDTTKKVVLFLVLIYITATVIFILTTLPKTPLNF